MFSESAAVINEVELDRDLPWRQRRVSGPSVLFQSAPVEAVVQILPLGVEAPATKPTALADDHPLAPTIRNLQLGRACVRSILHTAELVILLISFLIDLPGLRKSGNCCRR